MIFYLLIYTLATFGCFAVVSSLTRNGSGTVVLDEGAHAWVDREALVAELREVSKKQEADPRHRHMSDVAEQLAQAFDGYPRSAFDPLNR